MTTKEIFVFILGGFVVWLYLHEKRSKRKQQTTAAASPPAPAPRPASTGGCA